MNILGIDFGSNYIRLSTINDGKLSMLLDKSSNRKMTNMLTFKDNRRLFGEDAVQHYVRNLSNSVVSLTQKIDEKSITVKYDSKIFNSESTDEKSEFNKTQLMVMILSKTLEAVNINPNKLDKITLSIPDSYSYKQRNILVNAFNILNIKKYCILNNSKAIAMNYGLYKYAKRPKRSHESDVLDTEHINMRQLFGQNDTYASTLARWMKRYAQEYNREILKYDVTSGIRGNVIHSFNIVDVELLRLANSE